MAELRYAGFTRRLFAFSVDWIIILILLTIINNLLPSRFWDNLVFDLHKDFLYSLRLDGMANKSISIIGMLLFLWYWFLFYFLVATIYNILMEASSRQATLGKILLKIKVTDPSGEKPSLMKIVLRNIFKFLSFIPIGLGFFMVSFNQTRQSLHDKLAKTVVIMR